MSLHLLAWEKKAWHPPSGSQVLAPFSTQPLPLAPTPRAALLRLSACPLPPQRSLLTPAPPHLHTASPSHGCLLLHGSSQRSPGAMITVPTLLPATFNSLKYFFQGDNLPPNHMLTFSSLHAQVVLFSFHPPWLYEWQPSRVSCQVFFCAFIALSQGDLASLGVSVLPCCTGQSQKVCKPAAAEEGGILSLQSRFRQGALFCSRSLTQFGRCSVSSCGSPVMGSCLCEGRPLPCCRGGSQDALGQDQLSRGPWDCSTDQPPAVSKLLVAPSPKPDLPVLQAGRYLLKKKTQKQPKGMHVHSHLFCSSFTSQLSPVGSPGDTW